jgi:hypothetical protein
MTMERIFATDNGQEGLYIKEIGIPIEISDSQLTNNTHGLRITQCNSNITVTSVTSNMNRGAGVMSDNSDGILKITRLGVAGNRKYGMWYTKKDTCKTPILPVVFARQLHISNSEFREHRESGLNIAEKCGMTSFIGNTNFQSNNIGVKTLCDNSNNNMTIEKCEFTNHTYISVAVNNGGIATIRNNVFKDNKYSCIDIQEKGIAMSLERNVFTGTVVENSLPLYVLDLKTISSVVILRNKAFMRLRYNVFNNPDIQFQLATTVRDVVYAIDASYNYWGSADVNDVTNSLYGYHHQGILAKIFYHPYLESADENDYNNASQQYPDVVQGRDIGGIVTDQVELLDTRIPYHVTKDVIIHSDGYLKIGEGVTLEFEPGRGIIVMGALDIRGSSSFEVNMVAIKQQNRHPHVRLLSEQVEDQMISGVIQIYSGAAWRSVCYHSLNKDSATLDFMCRAAGYEGHTGYTSVQNNSMSFYSLSTIQCRSGRITECIYPAGVFTNCSGDAVLGISCRSNYWTGIHLTIGAQPSIIRNARLYQTNHRPSFHPSHAALHVDILQNHVISNVHIADMFDHQSSRGLFVSRIGVDSNSIDYLSVVIRSGIAVESHDSRIHLNDLNVTCVRSHAGYGVYVESKLSTFVYLRNEHIAPFTSFRKAHVARSKPLFLNVSDRSLSNNADHYVIVSTSEGYKIAAEVVRGSFSACSTEKFYFYDGLHNESAAVGLTYGLDGQLFRSTGSTVEIRLRRLHYHYDCLNVVVYIYAYKGNVCYYFWNDTRAQLEKYVYDFLRDDG